MLCPNLKSLVLTVSVVAMTQIHRQTYTYSHIPNTEEILLYFADRKSNVSTKEVKSAGFFSNNDGDEDGDRATRRL